MKEKLAAFCRDRWRLVAIVLGVVLVMVSCGACETFEETTGIDIPILGDRSDDGAAAENPSDVGLCLGIVQSQTTEIIRGATNCVKLAEEHTAFKKRNAYLEANEAMWEREGARAEMHRRFYHNAYLEVLGKLNDLYERLERPLEPELQPPELAEPDEETVESDPVP